MILGKLITYSHGLLETMLDNKFKKSVPVMRRTKSYSIRVPDRIQQKNQQGQLEPDQKQDPPSRKTEQYSKTSVIFAKKRRHCTIQNHEVTKCHKQNNLSAIY
jgi:hypothetical protein